jgi:hypothetical protein
MGRQAVDGTPKRITRREQMPQALKVVEKDEAIKCKINRKFSKTQPVVSPHALDQDGFVDQFNHGLESFVKALYRDVLIMPVLAMGILEGISAGFLAGARKVVKSYETRI